MTRSTRDAPISRVGVKRVDENRYRKSRRAIIDRRSKHNKTQSAWMIKSSRKEEIINSSAFPRLFLLNTLIASDTLKACITEGEREKELRSIK